MGVYMEVWSRDGSVYGGVEQGWECIRRCGAGMGVCMEVWSRDGSVVVDVKQVCDWGWRCGV
jgi:hypothetical protein